MSRTNPNGTHRGAFGPNARGALAVWRSKDYGQTFQWSSFFDPTDYFTGSCAYPQYRNPSQTANGYLGIPWDMGGCDGQAVWADPMTGKITLTFQCVGFLPTKSAPWTLLLNNNASDNRASTPVNLTIIASFDGKAWTALAIPKGVSWRIGAIPYNQFMLLGMSGSLMIGDMTNTSAQLQNAYPINPLLTPVPSGWPNTIAPPFLSVSILTPNVLTKWGYDGYAFAYATNNASNGGPPVDGYSVYYFTLPSQMNNGNFPNPRWAQAPSQINPSHAGGFISDVTAIDVGSGTTLLYWYDVDVNGQQANIVGRLLEQSDLFSQDFTITSFSVQGGKANFWGDYKTAGGYCFNDGRHITTVYYPM